MSVTCSDTYIIEIGQTGSSEKSGKYGEFCSSSIDNEPIYKHETGDFYLSHFESQGINFWTISERINGDLLAEFFGVNTASTNCPDSLYTPLWFYLNNRVNVTVTMAI